MAEAALGAAGSIASLVSLAGQVVQGILILHGFYNDIRDAPEEVRSLRIELDQFRKLYEGLEKLSKLYRPCDMTDNVFDDLHSALIPCKDLTDKLVHQIGKYNVQHGSGKRKRVWSQVKLAVRKQQYRDYLAALERAKSTLIATQISMNTTILLTQPSLRSRGTSGHESASTDALTVIGEVDMRSAKIFADAEASAIILTQTQEALMETKDLSEQINDTVRSLLGSQAGSIKPIESALRKILEEKLLEINEGQAGLGMANGGAATHSKSTLADTQAEQQSSQAGRFSPSEPQSRHVAASTEGHPLSTETVTRSKTTDFQRYSYWFGTVVLITTSHTRNTQTINSLDPRLAQRITETEICFMPANFLMASAMSAKYTRIAAQYRKPSMLMHLEPLRIISPQSPMAIAVGCGDLLKVQKLLGQGHAAFSDRFSDGTTLVDACLTSMFGLLELQSCGGNNFFTSFSQEVLRKWSRLVHLTAWLLQQGVDAGAARTDEQWQSSLHEVLAPRANMKYFGKERQMLEQDLNQLGELMLRTVSSNPIDLTERSVMITNIITDYVYKEIESPILSVLLAQRRWSFDWTTLKRWIHRGPGYHLRYLRNRSNIIQKLIRAAIEAKSPTPVDATGLPLEVSESVFAVHAAIRRGLYELRPGSTRERQHYQKWVDLRRSTVTDMSVLLGYDAAVVTVKQRGETLTECARRWKVVDVFEEALNQAGYDARLLAGIDIKPTESCEENFPTNNNATPSSFGAWGAAPIGPSTIAVYLEFPNISGNSCLEELSWEVPNDRLQPYLREPGLTSLCCDIPRRGEELCVDIHEGSSNKEEDDLFNPRNSDTEFWRGEGSVDDGVFVKVLKAAGYLLSVIY